MQYIFRIVRQVVRLLQTPSFRRYLLTGICAFAVDYLVLTSLYYVLNVWLVVATSAGFISGLVVSFTVNRLWVFGRAGRQRNPFHQSAEYITLVIFNYLFTVLVVSGLNHLGIQPFYGKILVTGCIVVWNYLLFKKIIFSKSNVN